MPTKTAEQTVPLELSAPVKLDETHDLDTFDCGEDSINEFLKKKALKAQAAKTATVFVVCIKGTNTVVGYHTLSSGTIMRANVVPKKAQRNSPTSTRSRFWVAWVCVRRFRVRDCPST